MEVVVVVVVIVSIVVVMVGWVQQREIMRRQMIGIRREDNGRMWVCLCGIQGKSCHNTHPADDTPRSSNVSMFSFHPNNCVCMLRQTSDHYLCCSSQWRKGVRVHDSKEKPVGKQPQSERKYKRDQKQLESSSWRNQGKKQSSNSFSSLYQSMDLRDTTGFLWVSEWVSEWVREWVSAKIKRQFVIHIQLNSPTLAYLSLFLIIL